MCAAATLPIAPLNTFRAFVDPTPTASTLINSFSIFINPADTLEILCKNTCVEPEPTAVDNWRGIFFLKVNGLWITLSIVIKVLLVASSVGTANVWVFPVPTLVIVNAVPAFALDALDANLNLVFSLIPSFTSTIAYTSSGKKFVLTPDIVAVSIPILVNPLEE